MGAGQRAAAQRGCTGEGVGAAAGGGRRRAAAAQAERPRGDGVKGRPSTETSTIMQSWSHPKLGLCVCLECNSWPYHTYEIHSYGTYAVLRCVLPLTRILLSKSGVPRGSLWPAGTPINCALVLRHTPTRVTRADVSRRHAVVHPTCMHEAHASLVLCRGCARCLLRSGAPWGRIRGRAVRTVVAGRTTMTTNVGSSSSRKRGKVRLACLVARLVAREYGFGRVCLLGVVCLGVWLGLS